MKKKHWEWLIFRKNELRSLLKIMKLSILLTLVCSLSLSASVLSQQKLKLNKGTTTYKELFKEIKKQTGFIVVYNNNRLDKNQKVDIHQNESTIESVLSEVLKTEKVDFKLQDEFIILVPKQETSKTKAGAQKRKVTGKVVDEEGLPLPGVTVMIKGTQQGIATDMDGVFTLHLADNQNTLVVSFIGMAAQEVDVTAKDNVTVTLKPDTQQIEEVVVSTGYQKIDRKLFTGSAVKLTADDAKVSGMVDVGRMMEGKVAGVQVQNVSGTFGAAPKIRVRGASSIYGDQKPLWVVDGVVLEDVVDVSADDLSSGDATTLISSSVAGINSDDIEDFQILKDAAATALYGARAMNGVIVIRTKSGKNGKTTINYTSNYTVKQKPNYDQFNIMNSKEQMAIYLEMMDKGWLNYADVSNRKNGGVFLKMYDLISTYDETTGKFGLENTPEAKANFLKKYEMANTDWFDILFNNSLAQEHSVSLSSGSEKSQTYVSTSFYNDEGWAKKSGVKRYTGNFKTKINLNKKLSFALSTVGSIREQEAPGTTARVDDVFTGSYRRNFDINPFSYALNTSRTMRAYDDNGNLEYYKRDHTPFNILNELNNNTLDLNVVDLKLQGEVDFKINKHLQYNMIGSVRYVKSTREHKITENSGTAEAYRMAINSTIRDRNKLLYTDPDNPNAEPVSVLPRGGFYNRYENTLKNFYFRNTVNYNQTFNEDHIVNVLAGFELKSTDRQSYYSNGPGYQYNYGGVPFIDYKYYKQAIEANKAIYSMGYTYDRFVAAFINTGYSYKGKYTINNTLRVDGSNQLGEDRSSRWLPTWNFSGSWVASEEDFMKDQEFISFLKLRATYGLTASMGAAKNSTVILLNSVTNRPYVSEKETGIEIDKLENKNLTWEKQYETNIGVDLGVLNNRINFSTDVYFRQGFDLIGLISASGIGGERLKWGNYADMDTKGIEFSVNTKNIENKDFKWTSTLSFGYNKNEITNLKSQPIAYDLLRAEGGAVQGGPVRGLYSIPFAGLDSKGIPEFYGPDGERTKDINLQSKDTDFLKYEGSVDPTYSGGLNNKIRFKNFTLNAFISFAGGNKIRLNPIFNTQFSDIDAMSKEFINRWAVAGDENITKIPAILGQRLEDVEYGTVRPHNFYNYSTERVANGDFVRLKSVSLDYAFNKELISKIGLKHASLKFQATNLWLIYADDKLNGQDPEFFAAGGVALPQPRQFTLSLKVGF
ncbi:SusC/RagA family TonB-linked outer membrane protein [Prolixibacteraceae bacterium JC049]|nr:SusC/RagA family TonB-linked outer membrane protein [Prolixibacteraceae bacterium JC049]